MTSSPAFRRFAFTFSTSFAILYTIALKWNLALVTVYPSLGIVLLGTHHSSDVADPAISFIPPAMYWYGWTGTAAVGALVLGLVSAAMPKQWTRRLWPGSVCAAPAAAMIICVYLTLPWLRL